MEILLAMATLLALITLVVLIGTKGKPIVLITQFGTFISGVVENRVQIVVFGIIILLSATVIWLFFIYPHAGAGPVQPIAFSHRLHAGTKNIDCKFCHPYVDQSIHPGIPPVEKCLFCHNYIIPNHPEIKKEHYYFDNQIPIPWQKVFILSEHVLFNHERHLKRDIACETCHGEVQAKDRLTHSEFLMGFCVECHREENANTDCWLSCHN